MDKKLELLRVLTELAAADREAYREIRSEAWRRIAAGHADKTTEQRKAWSRNAS
jgi:hypothetical protein